MPGNSHSKVTSHPAASTASGHEGHGNSQEARVLSVLCLGVEQGPSRWETLGADAHLVGLKGHTSWHIPGQSGWGSGGERSMRDGHRKMSLPPRVHEHLQPGGGGRGKIISLGALLPSHMGTPASPVP